MARAEQHGVRPNNNPGGAVRASSAGVALDPRWLAFLGLAVLVLVLYWPSVRSLWLRWQPDPSYSHGWLIVLVSAWLVWRVARSGKADHFGTSPWAALALPVLGLGWFVARAAGVDVVQWLILPAMMFVAAVALFGIRAAKPLAFPFGFSLFAIPIWDWLKPVLQEITVVVVGSCLHAVRIPAYIVGNQVQLPAGSFQVVEGCSGMHFFMVSLMLGSLYGYLFYGRWRPTLILLGVALVVAIIANWLRVGGVIVAGHLTDMQHFLVTKDHHYFGWAMYAVLMTPVLFFARRLEPQADGEPAGSNPGVLRGPRPAWLASLAVAIIGLALAPAAWALVVHSDGSAAPAAMPGGSGRWERSGAVAETWAPHFRGADAELSARYARGADLVDAWIFYYAAPAYGRELLAGTNRFVKPSEGTVERRGPDELVIRSRDGERVVKYWFDIGGRTVLERSAAKKTQVMATLSGRPQSALVAAVAACAPDCEAASARLNAFMDDMGDALAATVAADTEQAE